MPEAGELGTYNWSNKLQHALLLSNLAVDVGTSGLAVYAGDPGQIELKAACHCFI